MCQTEKENLVLKTIHNDQSRLQVQGVQQQSILNTSSLNKTFLKWTASKMYTIFKPTINHELHFNYTAVQFMSFASNIEDINWRKSWHTLNKFFTSHDFHLNTLDERVRNRTNLLANVLFAWRNLKCSL